LNAESAEDAQQVRVRNQAALYRAALLLGLVRGDVVIRWADSVIEEGDTAPYAFIELSTIDPADVTALRHALLALCDEKENDVVARKLLALIDADLRSGRRSYKDTLMVLRQMRSFLKLPRPVDDQIKTLLVESYAAKPEEGAIVELRAREWLAGNAGG
jgi:hypothetical protein